MLLGNDAAVNYHGVPPNLLERESELCTYCSAICANYQSKIPEMIHRLRMSTISPTEKRNDLHLTTTGVGHAFRPSIPFPPADFKAKQMTRWPLPSKLSSTQAVSSDDVFVTTTGSAHDYKHGHSSVQEHAIFKKAPSHMKVNHTLDTVEKLNQKPWRRALSMGNQLSEAHDKFAGRPDTIACTLPHTDPMPAILSDHHSEGPMKELSPTTVNTSLKGRSFVPQHQGVLDRTQPYMTTNNWYHRTFSRREMGQYPKKDVATYWQCEDYPKAWGFGMKQNPLPKRLCRSDPGAMRDRMVFRTATSVSIQPQSLYPVSNGLKSQYTSSFAPPPEEKRRALFYCPVEPSYSATVNDTSLLNAVPNMYQTLNSTYGSDPVFAQ